MLTDLLRSWFKGADSSSLCIVMESILKEKLPELPPENQAYVQCIVEALESANAFMKGMFHAGVWLLDFEREALIKNGLRSLERFSDLADQAYEWGLTRWKYQTKFHYFAEILWALQHDRARGLTSLNPVSCSTQMDEDMVGKVSQASRKAASRTIHVRTLERYLLHLCCHW